MGACNPLGSCCSTMTTPHDSLGLRAPAQGTGLPPLQYPEGESVRNDRLGQRAMYICGGVEDTRQVPKKNLPLAVNQCRRLLEWAQLRSGELGHQFVAWWFWGKWRINRHTLSDRGSPEVFCIPRNRDWEWIRNHLHKPALHSPKLNSAQVTVKVTFQSGVELGESTSSPRLL